MRLAALAASLFALTALVGCAAKAPAVAAAPAPVAAAAAPAPTWTPDQQAAYALGLEIGIGLSQLEDPAFDMGLFVQAIEDTLKHGKTKMNVEEAGKVKQAYFERLMKAQQEKAAKVGQAYLDSNAKQPGVVTLPSGLQYKVIKMGPGAAPKDSQEVVVHYVGTLTDGTEFDSSRKRSRPFTLKIQPGYVIDGWLEALRLMPEGSIFQVTIPAALGYGDRPTRTIPANSVLIFEIELLKVAPTAEEKQALLEGKPLPAAAPAAAVVAPAVTPAPAPAPAAAPAPVAAPAAPAAAPKAEKVEKAPVAAPAPAKAK